MMRWTLLACCFVLGACKTVTPPAPRNDASATGGDFPPAAAIRPGPPAGAKSEPANGCFAKPAAREDLPAPLTARQAGALPPVPVKSSGVEPEGGSPRRQIGLAGACREPVERLAPPVGSRPPAESVALPPLPSARRGEAASKESLSLPVSLPIRNSVTHDAASLPLPSPLQGGSLSNRQLTHTLALPFLDKPPAVKPEGGVPQCQIGLAGVCSEPVERFAPPVGTRPSAEPVALPLPLSARRDEEPVGGALPLPAASPVRHGATNSALPSPVTIPQWVADAQMESAWRESELDRQTRTQKEREEQFQQFRRAFYRFLSVNAGD